MDELTPEESALLFSVIAEAERQGDHEKADALAELAADPAKLRAILQADDDPGKV